MDQKIGLDKVLLIASDHVLVSNVRAALSECKLQLSCVATKEEAICWLEKQKVDAILLFDNLKEPDAHEMINMLRQAAKENVLIFGINSVSEDYMQKMITDSGVDGIVQRPFFASNLARAVERIRTNPVMEIENDTILRGMRFLCAEDNELNAEILQEILSMYGQCVQSA